MRRSRAAVLIAVMGCSGGGGGSIPIDSMPAEASKAFCAKAYECCSAAETANNQTYGPDQPRCESNLKGVLEISKGASVTAEGKGRLAYRGDKLKQCLDAYAKKTCMELKRTPSDMISECGGVFEPKVALDGACNQDSECLSGACTGALNQEGKCTTKVTVGGSCSGSGATCTDDGYCRSGSLTDGGFGSLCTAKKADGAMCRSGSECTTGGCNGINPDGGMPNMGSCGERGGPGTTCFITDGCSSTSGLSLAAIGAAALARVAARRRRP